MIALSQPTAQASMYSISSETRWNTSASILQSQLPYSIHFVSIEGNTEESSQRLDTNLKKLERISSFSENWNGYGAQPLSPRVIKRAEYFVRRFIVQPEIFPIADGAIQVEWEKSNGEYLEIQINLDEKIPVFMIDADGKEFEMAIEADIDSINEVLGTFYANAV